MSDIDWAALHKESTEATLPDGDYNVIVTEADMTQSANGKPMIKTKLRVIDGPKKDRPVWTQFTISAESPIALRIFFQQMATFGLTADYFAANPPPAQVARDLINRMVTVTLSSREWNGALRNQVDQVKAFSGTGPPPPGAVVGPPAAVPSGVSPVGGPPVPATPSAAPAPGVPAAPPVPAQPF